MKTDGWPEYFGIVYLPIILIGIVGNSLSFHIYRKFTKSTISMMLYSLSFCDLLLLILALPVSSFSYLPIGNYKERYSIRRTIMAISGNFIYPLVVMAKTSSLYIIVVITIERWIAVCRPLQVQVWCTYKRTVKIVISITIFSMIFNFPKFFEYSIRHHPSFGIWMEPGLLNDVDSPWYHISYDIILSVIVDYLIPFTVMTVANYRVIHELRRSTKRRETLTISQCKEQKTTIMLLVVTVLFGVCHFFTVIIKILECILEYQLQRTDLFEIAVKLSNMFIIAHSSVTFFIYYNFSSKFRDSFFSIFKNSTDVMMKPDDLLPAPVSKRSTRSTEVMPVDLTSCRV